MAENTHEILLGNLKEELVDIWSRPAVIAELGAKAFALSRIAEGLFEPELIGGKMRMSTELEDTEAVGVLFNPPYRDVVIHKTLVRGTPNQRRQIEKTLIEQLLQMRVTTGLDAEREAVRATAYFEGKSFLRNSGNSSFVTSNSRVAGLSKGDSVLIRGRPVILHCLESEDEDYTNLDLYCLAHEIEHARQILDEPAQVFRTDSFSKEMVDDTAKRELLAYKVGLVTATASDHFGRHWSDPSLHTDFLHLRAAYQIESARVHHGNGPDAFDVTRPMAAALHKQNLLHALVY